MSEQQVLPQVPTKARWESWADYWRRAFDERTSQLHIAIASLAQSEAERERLQGEAKVTEELECEIYMALHTAGCPNSEKVEGERHSRWLNSRQQIRWLAADLARERELNQGLRQATLMEALKAVESERLESHHKIMLGEYREPDEEDGDMAYSHAIHDAEDAIKQLFADKSKPVVTAEEQ